MVHARFFKLDSEKQKKIFEAAFAEFATHGFAEASLNRVISNAEMSKGSVYYYFNGKEDLYEFVLRNTIEKLLVKSGPYPVPETEDTDEFWKVLEGYYLRTMQRLLESPQTSKLIRNWISGSDGPAVAKAGEQSVQETSSWFMKTILKGQRIGAIRNDLPAELLITMAGGLGTSMDTWLVGHAFSVKDLETEVPRLFRVLRSAFSG
ncbi:MAG: TetR/AcrR family transcriptional regulator [Microbacteriaceae bacterium]|mgnify:CR=1 FL=1|nr:TetR/AcrR family transcriptional regulator [Cryobacterium sp.]MBX3103965.1 TetR/AcrR family transcriptional regulator [Cryobacterium sp.]MCC6376884.1 TetR/AcrR family transcriptional regulator [Microbacteriaceae bacterium]